MCGVRKKKTSSDASLLTHAEGLKVKEKERGERNRDEREREEGGREEERNTTSNHNLALCRVVSLRLEEALRNEFVRFGGLSCLCALQDRVQRTRAYFHG